jgi:pre-mRNA-processing factor 40
LEKEDAFAVFKEALRDAGVTSSWKWEDANRVVLHDPRVRALRAISERKSAFNEYVNEIKARERNDARQRRQ